MLAYLHALNWVLDDAIVDDTERDELEALAIDLGLDPVDTTRMHSQYLQHLVAAATRDGIITTEERDLLERVAEALGMDRGFLPSVTTTPTASVAEGMRVCFTGDAVQWPRADLEAAAALAGFRPVNGVTKKGCDLVVAADPSTQSGKAAKARQYGIPIIGLAEFLARLGR